MHRCIAPGLCVLLVLAAVPANAQTTATASSAADTATTRHAGSQPPPRRPQPQPAAEPRALPGPLTTGDGPAEDLVSRMTVEEKVSQMVHEAGAVERLGIPRTTGGTSACTGSGARGYSRPCSRRPSASPRRGTLTDRPPGRRRHQRRGGAKHHAALGADGASAWYFGLTFWSPNINIFRDPRWGRGQETYGEDPYLSARMGVEFVRGLQGDDPRYLKLVATPKHYAVHSGPEQDRHGFDAQSVQQTRPARDVPPAPSGRAGGWAPCRSCPPTTA